MKTSPSFPLPLQLPFDVPGSAMDGPAQSEEGAAKLVASKESFR